MSSLELLVLLGIPVTLVLAWQRPPEGRTRSSAVTALVWLLTVGSVVVVLFGLVIVVMSIRQDHRDPNAEFAGLGEAIGAVIAIGGGVLLLTFVAALVIRAMRR